MILTILQSVLAIIVVLLPAVLAARAESKPVRKREAIDAILVKGSDTDVALELSRMFDDAGGPVKRPGAPLPDEGLDGSVSGAPDQRGLSPGHPPSS